MFPFCVFFLNPPVTAWLSTTVTPSMPKKRQREAPNFREYNFRLLVMMLKDSVCRHGCWPGASLAGKTPLHRARPKYRHAIHTSITMTASKLRGQCRAMPYTHAVANGQYRVQNPYLVIRSVRA